MIRPQVGDVVRVVSGVHLLPVYKNLLTLGNKYIILEVLGDYEEPYVMINRDDGGIYFIHSQYLELVE